MRISDLTDTIRLYRGDASFVDRFEVGKTDAHALFGHGIYLTDSAEVATDYTLKANEDVIFPVNRDDNGPFNSQQDLVRAYLGKLALELGFKHAHDEARKKFERLANDKQAEVYKNANGPVGYDVIQAELAGIHADWAKARRALAQKFIAQAKKVYAGQDIRMAVKTTGEWVFVKSERRGIVSAFDVPRSYVSKTLDAEAPMPESLLPIVKAAFYTALPNKVDGPLDLRVGAIGGDEEMGLTFDQYIDGFKTKGSRYAWAGHRIGGKGLPPSIDEIINGTHAGYYVWEKAWDVLVRKLQAMGYVGFKYQGGIRIGGNGNRGGGGILHNAYSFWDEKTINGFRVDHHPRAPDMDPVSAKGVRAKGIL